MKTGLLQGKLVRLSSPADPEEMAKTWARWMRDMDYYRPLDSDPPYLFSIKRMKEWEEKELEKPENNAFFFTIRTLPEEQMIGFIALWGISWTHGEAYVALGIGEPQYRSKGYGTEAMGLALQYAFEELNLQRVTLLVFEYNQRAIRSYEKSGFIREGTIRQAMRRDGRRWDWYLMGILRSEWQAIQPAA